MTPRRFKQTKVRIKTRPTTIRFYRMFVDGTQQPFKILDGEKLHSKLEALEFDSDVPNSRYYKNGDGDEFVGKSFFSNKNLRLRIAKKTPAPHFESGGVFKIAPAPSATARWIAPSYCVFFPSNNIVGVIFSLEGPRMHQVCRYLEDAAQYGHRLEAAELARPNVREEIDRLASVTRFIVRYRASQTPSLFAAERTDIDSVMKSYADLNEDAEITVNVKSTLRGGGVLRGVKKAIEQAFAGESPNLSVEKFIVYGPDKYSKRRSKPVDLLLSRLRATVEVPVEEKGTQLVEDAAFGAIEEAYAEHLTQFPSISVIDGTSGDAMEQ